MHSLAYITLTLYILDLNKGELGFIRVSNTLYMQKQKDRRYADPLQAKGGSNECYSLLEQPNG